MNEASLDLYSHSSSVRRKWRQALRVCAILLHMICTFDEHE